MYTTKCQNKAPKVISSSARESCSGKMRHFVGGAVDHSLQCCVSQWHTASVNTTLAQVPEHKDTRALRTGKALPLDSSGLQASFIEKKGFKIKAVLEAHIYSISRVQLHSSAVSLSCVFNSVPLKCDFSVAYVQFFKQPWGETPRHLIFKSVESRR